MKISLRAAAAGLNHMAFVVTVGSLAAGIAGIVALHISDHRPSFDSAAYVARAEIRDSAIEDVTDRDTRIIRRAHDGLFYATLTINNKELRCIVDTGASATVLSAQDSRRLGVWGNLRFSGRIHTVGGHAAAARGRLDEVRVAGHSFRHVPAFVVRGKPTPCLFGQDLIARLDAAEIRGNTLTLR